MQSLRGLRQPSNLGTVYEHFEPSSDWIHDPTHHTFILDLPGFKKDEIRTKVESSGKITISGEKRVIGKKVRRFTKNVKAPQDTNLDKVTAKFEHGLLYLCMPKKEVPPPESSAAAATAAAAVKESTKTERGKEEEARRDQDEGKRENMEEAIRGEMRGRLEKKEEARGSEEEDEEDLRGEKRKKTEEEARGSEEEDKEDLRGEKRKKTEEEKEDEPRREKAAERRQKGGVFNGRTKEGVGEKKGWFDHFHETDFVGNMVEKARENKAVVIATVVVALSVGIFVSRKLRSR